MNQQILFVVGPDRCGKTNIAKEIAELLNISYFKASSEHSTFLGEQNSFMNQLKYADPRVLDFVKQTKTDVVFDRGFPCEYSYSRYFRRQSCNKTLQLLNEGYAALGAKVLICTRKSFSGISDDLDPDLDEQALTTLSEYYEEFARTSRCEVHTLYVDDFNLNRQVNEALLFMGWQPGDISRARYDRDNGRL